jgi:UDP-glucose 4-epimerase
MRVVVTGASGNVGTALLRALSAEHDVVGLVRRPPAPQGVYERADWRSLDLTEPAAIAFLCQAFDGADVVVHLAWGFQPTRDTQYLTPTRRRWDVGGATSCPLQRHRSTHSHVLRGNLRRR